MKLLEFLKLLGTEPAIQTLDALKALGSLAAAAIIGPLVIGGLFFLLKETNKTD